MLNVYKTPRDKMHCIERCCETVENLVRLAVGSAPAADHITPVLIYVVLHVRFGGSCSLEYFCAHKSGEK